MTFSACSIPTLRRFFAAIPTLRRSFTAGWILLAILGLAGCSGVTIPGISSGRQAAPPQALPPGEAPVTVTPLPGEGGPAPLAAGEKAKIALLLPLSGPNAALGHGMLDAAQMALFDMADEHLTLLPRDTQGSAEGAAAAASAALDQGARLIIGPLIAAEVEAVKPIAQARGIPMLAFSTAATLAGDGTWLLGFMPRQEVPRVVAYSRQQGVQSFAALAPNSAYGQLAVEALKSAVEAQHATLGPIIYFDPGALDLTSSVRQLKAAASGQGFDALLLPEGGQQLKTLVPLLPINGFDPAKLHFLGTGLWDDPTLLSEPELQGGWYAAPDPTGRGDFEKRFAELYGHGPPRLSTLAYDATALAAALARNEQGPDFSPAALTNENGFLGLDGIFRLRSDGLVERGLAVIEIHRGGSTVVGPAPQDFQNLGY